MGGWNPPISGKAGKGRGPFRLLRLSLLAHGSVLSVWNPSPAAGGQEAHRQPPGVAVGSKGWW